MRGFVPLWVILATLATVISTYSRAAAYVNEMDCFPTAPSEPTGFTASTNVNGVGGIYLVTAWRQACPQRPSSSVLMLKFQSVTGNPSVFANDVLIGQAGVSYSGLWLHKSRTGSQLSDLIQAGRFSVSSAVVVQTGARFDPDGRLSISFNDVVNGGRKSMTLEPASTAPASASVSVGFGNFSDMWWDDAENGTGMSIIHHGSNQMFIVWYTYTDTGEPLWLVFPGGTWTDNRTFTGALYKPRGTSFARPWNAAAFQVGAAVGNGTISITAADEVKFTYAINGVSGTKTFTRQGF